MTDQLTSYGRRSPPACSRRTSSSAACSARSWTSRARSSARKASSILLFEPETEELVFAAVSGEGERSSSGAASRRRPAWPAGCSSRGTPLVLEDVQSDPRFARDVAEKTGYVPKGLMAVPLLDEENDLGVLQVLDRPQRSRFTLQEMELLGLFAGQAAIALGLLRSAQRARAALDGEGELATVAALAGALDTLEGRRRAEGIALLRNLGQVLRQR